MSAVDELIKKFNFKPEPNENEALWTVQHPFQAGARMLLDDGAPNAPGDDSIRPSMDPLDVMGPGEAAALGKAAVAKLGGAKGIGMAFPMLAGALKREASEAPALAAQKQVSNALADSKGYFHPDARREQARTNQLMDLLKKNPAAKLEPRVADALPMDEASRLARAKEMGFDTSKTYYHGTNTPESGFESFDLNRPPKGADETVSPRGAAFLTENPKFASNFASIRSKPGAVIPTHVSVAKTFDYENPEHVKALIEALPANSRFKTAQHADLKSGDWEALEDGKVMDAIRSLGFDSMHIKEAGTKNLAVFDPSKIRSKFAEFDPAKKDSSHLSAGVAGATLLGAGAASEEAEASPPPPRFKRLNKK